MNPRYLSIDEARALDAAYVAQATHADGPYSAADQTFAVGQPVLTMHDERFCIARIYSVIHRHEPQFVIAELGRSMWRIRTAAPLLKDVP